MKHELSSLLVTMVTLTSLEFSSCGQNPAASSNTVSNLVSNSNFQVGDTASLAGWVTAGPTAIVTEPPPSDGRYSLEVGPGAIGWPSYARTYISAQSGSGVYKLSVWQNSFANFYGTIYLGLWKDGSFLSKKSYSTNSSGWQLVSIVDTLSTQPTDTIAVELFGGAYESVNRYWKVFFGSVRLERTQ